jgi:hypothetical protein
MPLVPFGEWLPDQPLLGSGKALLVTNTLPVPGGYGPLPDLAIVSNALTARCQGIMVFKSPEGATLGFAGDATKLYRLINTTFTDISGETYRAPDDNFWRFAQFGDNILAANGSNRLQRFNMKSSSAFAEVTNGPHATHLAVVKDFVVASVEDDANKIWWSARNNSESWEATVNSSGRQPLPEGGRVMGLVGGEYGTIFQEDAITRMSFVGGQVVFQFDKLITGKGCLAQGSIVEADGKIFYYSKEGFMAFDGVEAVPIGHGKVDDTFLDEVNYPYLYRMSAGVDSTNKIVAFAYPTTASADGTPDAILFYNWGENRWSDSDKSVELMFSDLSESTDLDSIATSIDTLTPPLDSDFYLGGLPSLGAFDAAFKLNRFTGANLAATIKTGEFQMLENNKARMVECNMLIDGTHTVTIEHRNRLTDAVTVDSAVTPQTSGRTPVRVNDRFFRAQANITAGATWTLAAAADPKAAPGGR